MSHSRRHSGGGGGVTIRAALGRFRDDVDELVR